MRVSGVGPDTLGSSPLEIVFFELGFSYATCGIRLIPFKMGVQFFIDLVKKFELLLKYS